MEQSYSVVFSRADPDVASENSYKKENISIKYKSELLMMNTELATGRHSILYD